MVPILITFEKVVETLYCGNLNSIILRALILIDLNQIKFDEEFDIYKIKEDNRDTRIVSKRDNYYFCSCIAKTTCCHIVAAKLYNNEPIEY